MEFYITTFKHLLYKDIFQCFLDYFISYSPQMYITDCFPIL